MTLAALETRDVVVQGELPHEKNRRGGPGWWMDLDGVWRAPEEWPEDYPPLDGWCRGHDGRWRPPEASSEQDDVEEARPPTVATLTREGTPVPKRRSRQANADRRAMYTVAGVIGGAMLLLVGALVVITQAGATDDETAAEAPEVIFAVETDADRVRRQRDAAVAAPAIAREQLEQLVVRGTDASVDAAAFDEQDWVAAVDGCLDRDEQVLVERSELPVTWADQLECVPDGGQWTDQFLGTVITRTIDSAVTELVPPSVVFESGGAEWSAATRASYVLDLRHPATLQVVADGSGHNPRSQDPSQWRPSAERVWCAYAVDWISVKAHWSLNIHAAEKDALSEMLDTCTNLSSDGANPATAIVDPLAPPSIERESAAS